TVDAALGVGSVKFPDSRDEYGVGVPRIDRDFSDVVGFVEAEVGPGFPGVDRLVDTVAVADGVTKRRFPTADEHDGRIRGCDGNRADRRDRLAVENRKPHPATVDRFPDAAIDRAEIEIVGTTGNAGRGGDAPTAEWPDHPPAQAGKKLEPAFPKPVVFSLLANRFSEVHLSALVHDWLVELYQYFRHVSLVSGPCLNRRAIGVPIARDALSNYSAAGFSCNFARSSSVSCFPSSGRM